MGIFGVLLCVFGACAKNTQQNTFYPHQKGRDPKASSLLTTQFIGGDMSCLSTLDLAQLDRSFLQVGLAGGHPITTAMRPSRPLTGGGLSSRMLRTKACISATNDWV